MWKPVCVFELFFCVYFHENNYHSSHSLIQGTSLFKNSRLQRTTECRIAYGHAWLSKHPKIFSPLQMATARQSHFPKLYINFLSKYSSSESPSIEAEHGFVSCDAPFWVDHFGYLWEQRRIEERSLHTLQDNELYGTETPPESMFGGVLTINQFCPTQAQSGDFALNQLMNWRTNAQKKIIYSSTALNRK